MSDVQRVVIRTSWAALSASVAPVAVALVIVQVQQHSLGGAIADLVVIAGVVALAHAMFYVELSPAGLGIHWLAMTTVPWQNIGSVDYMNKYGSGQVKVEDQAANRGRRLPAPRRVFGLGTAEAESGCKLIEQWWLAYRGQVPPADPMPAPPRDTPADPVDPWTPPVVD